MIWGLDYAFMRHAFSAGAAISIAAAVVGYFVILRRQAFAAHALSHVGFTGAAAAILLGLSPYTGLFAATFLTALGLAWLGNRVNERDIAVGMILMFSLGLGVLFLNLYTTNSQSAMGILFGSIVGITAWQTSLSVVVALLVLLVMILVFRPLLFMCLNEEAAAGRGVPVQLLHLLFLLLVAATVAIAVPIIGALLIFALLVGPPAAARSLTRSVGGGIFLALILGLLETLGGIACSYSFGYPASTWIASLSFFIYVIAYSTKHLRIRYQNQRFLRMASLEKK